MNQTVSPSSLERRARDNFRFVDQVVQRAVAFTAVPGRGGVGMGVIALVATPLAAVQGPGRGWLIVWLLAALPAMAVGVVSIGNQMQKTDRALFARPTVRFAQAFLPSLLVGAALTALCASRSLWDLLPGVWLLTYGAGVRAAGTTSVKLVSALGGCLMALGLTALWFPAAGDVWMAAGFGGCQIIFGVLISRSRNG